ncbi:sortase domain-containing protein [Nocardioides dongkuii]|uniref:sortase domain-containing protein n=1 Tax=Nocardioides dongkuii TaxID=2760089 RepID=UPI0015F7F2F2|nr:sortase [Nocardioides dongkuii]
MAVGSRPLPGLLVLLLAPAIVACAADEGPGQPRRTTAASASAAPAPAASPVPPASPEAPAEPTPTPPPGPEPSAGRPARAVLSIPALGIRDLVVVPYRGRTDDAPGTAIQNRGLAASPHGPAGGTGPGGIGNYQVTAHRLSSTRAFEFLPRLRPGARVHVVADGVRYTYRITGTRETSFRSPRSLRQQRAAVPGRPGVAPTRAMVTLSTCATPEDHAVGNYWSDEHDNPEHRIDKIGELVAAAPDQRDTRS